MIVILLKQPFKASSAAILARILVINTNFLAQLTSDPSEPSLSSLLQQADVPILEENKLLCLVDIWLDKVDNVSSTQKKTFGLALSLILTLRLPQVLNKLDQILSVCTSVILGGTDDLTEEESSGDIISSGRSDGEGTLPSKEFRKRQIKFSDPINQISLENSLRDNLQTCAGLHGESFNSAICKDASCCICTSNAGIKDAIVEHDFHFLSEALFPWRVNFFTLL